MDAALRPGDVDGTAPPPSLPPWEQHGGVIHMPRYLYSPHAAPLLQRSGFLVTCAYQREKSATKEAMEILHEFLGVTKPHNGVDIVDIEPDADTEPDAKRAKTEVYLGSTKQKLSGQIKVGAGTLSSEEEETRAGKVDEENVRSKIQCKLDGRRTEGPLKSATTTGLGVDNAESVTVSDKETALDCSPPAEIKQQEFRLVKLARNGMVYISIPSRPPGDLITFFTRIINDFHSRSKPAPRWCHRIFPAQATCLWNKEDVWRNVVVLVKEFIKGHDITSNSPLKYAVALNRRGLEEKEKTGEAATSTFGKLECIHAVGGAILSLTPFISVDLTNPQMVVMLEVLPLVRVETSVCAVSVLPRDLVVTKPKLVIQALAPSKKQKRQK